MASNPTSTAFQENERVLCFHGPLIYEAKIQKVEFRDKQIKYFIHYHGWNKNWDEWVPEARMLKYTETNLEKRRSLMKSNDANARAKKAAAAKKKAAGLPGTNSSATTPPPPCVATTSASTPSLTSSTGSAQSLSPETADKAPASASLAEQEAPDLQNKSEKSTSSDDVLLNPPPEKQARSSSRKSATPTSTTAKNNAKRVQVSAKEEQQRQEKPDGTVETEEQFYTKVEVRIKVPDELRPYLVDDWDYVTRQRKLIVLPARVTVDQIIQDFVKNRTSKSSTSASKSNREAAILDVTAGLVEYFNVMLGSQLLYKFEREQHSDILKEHPEVPVSKIYGAIHLLRLFVKLGGLLTYTPLDAKSVHLLQFYVNDFLQYMKKNAASLFTIQDYGTASPEYYRRSL